MFETKKYEKSRRERRVNKRKNNKQQKFNPFNMNGFRLISLHTNHRPTTPINSNTNRMCEGQKVVGDRKGQTTSDEQQPISLPDLHNHHTTVSIFSLTRFQHHLFHSLALTTNIQGYAQT